MKNILKVALLGLAHGISDCAAGYMIGRLQVGAGLWDVGAMILLYNVLAFGMQVPMGMLLDRVGKPKWALMLSLAMVAAALGLHVQAPLAAIALAGVAGSIFHVSGGMMALLAFPGSSVGAGLFAAPGVMGLMLGGYLAWQGMPATLGLAASALGLMALLAGIRLPDRDSAPLPAAAGEPADWHDFLMIVLLLAIALRSAVWNLFELLHEGQHATLLLLGAAAMLGKAAGGLIAQRIGHRRYAVVALGLSLPLLLIGGTRWVTLLPGIFLLQSATPVAMAGMWRLMPRLPATAAGMCLGLAIAVGGLPAMAGWKPPLWEIGIAIPLAAGGYWLALRRRRVNGA